MKAISPLCKSALILLLGGIVALHGSAIGHDHSDLSDAFDCPCVHADKAEWDKSFESIIGAATPNLSTFVAIEFPLDCVLNFLPVRARSPPLP